MLNKTINQSSHTERGKGPVKASESAYVFERMKNESINQRKKNEGFQLAATETLLKLAVRL